MAENESDTTRKLSLLLFGQVKPTCIKLLNIVSSPGALPEVPVNRLLKEVDEILELHRRENKGGDIREQEEGRKIIEKDIERDLEEDIKRDLEVQDIEHDLDERERFDVALESDVSDLNNLMDSISLTTTSNPASYVISKKLSDYIFVPISYLLKRPNLNDSTITSIQNILSFLINYSWSVDVNLNLIDQLYPLVLYLSGGDMKSSIILTKSLEFKASSVKCLEAIVHTLPNSYFQDKTLLNRLNFMGSSITLLLDIVKSTSSNSLEDIKLVNDTINLIRMLSIHLSADLLSNILPSITSRLISFATSNNLHFTIIIRILNTLKLIIVKVFNDESLSVVLKDESPVDLEDLNEIWKDSKDLIDIEIPKEMVYRTKSWLKATSKQLKLSLVVLFRYLLITSNVKEKLKVKRQLHEEVVNFVQDINDNCFLSLFNEFFLLGVDIYGLVISIVSFDDVEYEKLLISEITKKVCAHLNKKKANSTKSRDPSSLLLHKSDILLMPKEVVPTEFESIQDIQSSPEELLLYRQILSKLTDLLDSKFSSILLSTDDEKINSYFVAIKLHFNILHTLSKDEYTQFTKLKLKTFKLLKKNLVDSFSNQKKFRKMDVLEILYGKDKGKGGNNSINEGENFSENGDPSAEMPLEPPTSLFDTSQNTLDSIQLPPHIDAKKISKMNQKQTPKGNYSTNLMILADKIRSSEDLVKTDSKQELQYFSEAFSSSIEGKIEELIKFIGSLEVEEHLELFEQILDEESDESLMTRSVGLWIANKYLEIFREQDRQKRDKLNTVTTQVTSSNLDSIENFSQVNSNLESSQKIEALEEVNSNPSQDLDEQNSFDIDEFLVFDEEDADSEIPNIDQPASLTTHLLSNESEDSELVEISYLIMSKSQDLFNEINSNFDTTTIGTPKLNEISYGIAIDSIGRLSNCLPLIDFQSDFLISYLYPLLDALTYQLNPSIQVHAKLALQLIINNYYGGSLETLLVDNLDYLIDSVSLKLTSIASFSPSLPGILLIILKITGMKLLINNQLNDILNEMFVLIDSYHGYSVLVEGFFIVFEEIIKQIGVEFMKGIDAAIPKLLSNSSINTSSYKPWGMTNTFQLLKLLEDSEKIIQPEGFDPTKEYFRKPNTPFGEQADSDDEEEEEEDEPQDTPEPWPSPIPSSIYFTVQRIYNYGFTLLNHQSNTLKFQILTTLKHSHPLLCTNYKLVMPLLSNNFPVLLTLMTGSSSLSTTQLADINENLIIPSLELILVILNEDQKQPIKFLARKFIDSWEFITKYSKIFRTNKVKAKSTDLIKSESQLANRHLNPKVLDLYVQYFTLGLEVYDKEIPDVLRYEILKFCSQLGFQNNDGICRNINNTMWVINNTRVTV
jgi:hypothetical protein